MREVKKLKYESLDGLSEKQLREHHDALYAGYVKKIGEIEEKLKNVDVSTANASYSDLRELKMEETFALNGVKLHEGYFDNMNKGGNEPSGAIKEMLARDFGSYENFPLLFCVNLFTLSCNFQRSLRVWGIFFVYELIYCFHTYLPVRISFMILFPQSSRYFFR